MSTHFKVFGGDDSEHSGQLKSRQQHSLLFRSNGGGQYVCTLTPHGGSCERPRVLRVAEWGGEQDGPVSHFTFLRGFCVGLEGQNVTLYPFLNVVKLGHYLPGKGVGFSPFGSRFPFRLSCHTKQTGHRAQLPYYLNFTG